MGWFKKWLRSLAKAYARRKIIKEINGMHKRVEAEYMADLDEYKVTYTDHKGNEISTVGSENEIMPKVLELIESHRGGYA